MDEELKNLVAGMLKAGESEDNIALVIRNYKPEKHSKQAGFFESAGKKAYNVFANQVPQAVETAVMMEEPPNFDQLTSKRGIGTYDTFGVIPSEKDFELPKDELLRKAKEAATRGIEVLEGSNRDYAKKSLQFIEEAYTHFPKAHPELIKDYVKTKFNQFLAGKQAKRFEEITKQQKESEELLKDVPQGFDDSEGNIAGLVGGAIGEGISQIPLTIASRGLSGFLLEQGDIYNEALNEKAKVYSEQYGIDITPEQLRLTGEDQDVQDLARNFGAFNAVLDLFGATKAAKPFVKEVVKKKILKEAIKKNLISKLKEVGTGTAAEFGTGFIQDTNAQIAASLASGKDVNEALGSVDWGRSLEAGVMEGIGGAGVSSIGATISAINNVIKESPTGEPAIDIQQDVQTEQVVQEIAEITGKEIPMEQPAIEQPVVPIETIEQPTTVEQSQITPTFAQETGPESGVMKFGQAAKFEQGVQKAYSDLQTRDNLRIQEEQKGVSQSPITAGVNPSNKIMAEEMVLLKNQIKFHARGIREGRIDEKKGRMDFVEDVKRAIGSQQVSPTKQSSILNKVARTNLLNPVQVRRTLNYVEKVVTDAAYSDRVVEGKDLSKKIKAKLDKFTPQQKPLVKELIRLPVDDVSDVALHNQILGGVLANTDSPVGGYEPIDAAQISKYVSDETDRQARIITEAQAEGFAEAGITQEELAEAESEEGPTNLALKDKLIIIADERKKALRDINISGRKSEFLDEFKKADLKTLTPAVLVAYIKGVDNIIINNDFGNLGYISAAIYASRVAPELSKLAVASGNITTLYSEQTDQWAEILKNLGNSSKWAAQVNATTNLNKVYGKNAQVTRKVEDFAIGIKNKAIDLNKKYKGDVMDGSSIIRMSQFGELVQSREDESVDEGFQRSKENIEIDLLTKQKSDPDQHKLEEEQWKSLRKATSVDEAIEIMKKKNPAEYEMWSFIQKEFESIYSDLSANTEALYGRILPKYRNYTPLVTRLTEQGASNKVLDEDVEDANNLLTSKYPVKPKAAKTTLSRADKLPPDRYYRDRDFISNILDRYQKSVYDTTVSYEVAKAREILRRDEFKTLMGTPKNITGMTNTFNNNIRVQRGVHAQTHAFNKAVGKFIGKIQKVAYIRALGGVLTGVSQAASSLANTTVQLGSDMGLLFGSYPGSKKVRDQYTISNRMRRMGGLRIDDTIDAKARAEFLSGIKEIKELEIYFDEKILPKIMASFTYGDVKPAEQAWNAYYLKSLKDQGIDTSNANKKEFWDNEATNQDSPERQLAASFAEQKVDENLLTSQQEKGARVIRTQDNVAAQTIKALAFPFVSYTLNLKKRIMNRTWSLVTRPSKEALVDLAAITAEVYAFALASQYIISPLTTMGKNAYRELFDIPPDEEDPEFQDKLFTTSLFNNLNPLAINELLSNASNDFINWITFKLGADEGQPYKEWKDQNGDPLLVFSKPFEEQLGMVSIAANLIDNLDEGSQLVIQDLSGGEPVLTITDDFGNEKELYLTDDEKQAIIFNSIVHLLALVGIQVRELTNTTRSTQKAILKQQGTGGGGGTTPETLPDLPPLTPQDLPPLPELQ